MSRRAFALSVLLCFATPGLALAQAAPAPQPQAPRVTRPAAPPAANLTLSIQVTDSSGLPLGNVQVTAQGPVSREGTTTQDGSLRFAALRAGMYRLRFVREGSNTLERDVTIRAGEPLAVDVSLTAAPPPPKPPEPVKPPPSASSDKSLGPPTDPKMTPIPTFLEKNFIGREGRKDSPLGCTTTGAATLVQIREALLNQTHDDADEWIYVVAGEGTLRLGTAEQHLQAGTFSLIPHTVSHGLLPTGRNPLIFVSVMSGYRTC
jgi:hypothetical protein